ncbi:sulfotransferase [Candidatus Neomarinimicrobiota bacterium]
MARLPNFIIVGAAKSGTTSLHHYLAQHPDIYMSEFKEPDYFALMPHKADFNGPGGVPNNEGMIDDWEAYTGLFADVRDEKAIGESSTTYLFVPQAAVNIKETIPDCRIIIILRHPVDRLISHYNDNFQCLFEELPLESAIAAEPERAAQNWRWGYQYTGYSRYTAQVKRYLDLFGSEQVRVYFFEQLRTDPHAPLADIFRFLEVEDRFQPDTSTRHKPSGRVRSMAFQRFLVRGNFLKRIFKPIIPSCLWNLIRPLLVQANRGAVKIEKDLYLRLAAMFEEDILALQDLLRCDLNHWLDKNQR